MLLQDASFKGLEELSRVKSRQHGIQRSPGPAAESWSGTEEHFTTPCEGLP